MCEQHDTTNKNCVNKSSQFKARSFIRLASTMCLTMTLCLGSGVAEARVAVETVDSTSAEIISAPDQQQQKRTLAIVIDDFGNDMKGTDEMMKLPVKFTAAIMPFMPTTKQDAEEAHRLGHDVIIHMPMEPNKGSKKWLGPGALTVDLTDAEVRQRLEEAIRDVPHAIGMNNHMGSKVTSDERMMRIILRVCKENGLFFLDSRTSYWTVVPKIAAELDVPIVSNDVFLDDIHTIQHITKQIDVLRKHLESHVSCITIGHVGVYGDKTASVLKQSIPALQPNVQFVKLSELIRPSVSDPFILPNS